LIAGGIALFIPGPWIVSRVFHTDFAASFLTFTALVNIHHFILDGALWKLRDSRVAALLLEGQQKTPGADTEKQNSIATAALLFIWAGVDQLRFWWASEANALPALHRAAALNPNDSSIEVRLARAEQLAGQRDAALAAMQRASALNPANLPLQESYGRSLIKQAVTAMPTRCFRRSSHAGRETPPRWSITECWRIASGMARRPS
jgi:hypothetical protein